MAGVVGRSGGARPGAGRKSAKTERYQARMREQFERAVTVEDWREIIAVAVEHAKAGDDRARQWLSPWVVGKVPDQVKHSGDEDAPPIPFTFTFAKAGEED